MGRAKLALGRLPAAAARVDLDTFQVPDSKFAREAEDACAEMPPALQGHSYRTWLFGRALAVIEGARTFSMLDRPDRLADLLSTVAVRA